MAVLLLLGAAAATASPALAAEPPADPGDAAAVRAHLDKLRRDAPALVKRRKQPAAVAQLLRAMVEVDQRARKLPPAPQSSQVMRAVDEHNLPILKRLVAELGWLDVGRYGQEADRDAWLLVQHADADPAFQKEMLAQLEKLAASGGTDRANFAYLFDRVAVAEKRRQRFGTQGQCIANGVWTPHQLEEPAQVDTRRTWAGLGQSLADYTARMHGRCRR